MRDKRIPLRIVINRRAMIPIVMVDVPLPLIAAIALSFAVSYLVIPIFNRFMVATGIVGRDIMKKTSKPIADMGGPGVITGFLLGVFLFIGFELFFLNNAEDLVYLLASLNTILIITVIGIFDVLTSLMKRREGKGVFESMKRRGIPSWFYFFIPLPAAVPLMAVNAGITSMVLPFVGRVQLGMIYPLVLVPLAVLCCSNATNFIAGFNGLEAGMGIVLHISLGIFALATNHLAAAVIALTFAAALTSFLRYNWYPAKVFPGDLNYTIGAVTACVTILGNMEKFAILCFTPWILEAILKAFSGFNAENYGILQEDGTVKPREIKIRSLTHAVMRSGRFTEKQVATILIFIEFVVCVVAFTVIRFI
jgi:UDP-N-acetylglucosamine--dolichyl-phosphate N-acetylglucosaminephosphotransferase